MRQEEIEAGRIYMGLGTYYARSVIRIWTDVDGKSHVCWTVPDANPPRGKKGFALHTEERNCSLRTFATWALKAIAVSEGSKLVRHDDHPPDSPNFSIALATVRGGIQSV